MIELFLVASLLARALVDLAFKSLAFLVIQPAHETAIELEIQVVG